MKKLLLIFFLLCGHLINAQQAFKIYNSKGKEVNITSVVKKVQDQDVILFGELHTNPICHWLQLRFTQELYAQKDTLAIGMEMFESDNQLIIDEYFSGVIREKDFKSECRLWNNYVTDYRPILEFAREKQINFVATNIPRRYAAAVNKKDFDGLEKIEPKAKAFIAPLPIAFDTNNPSVQKMLKMDFGHGMGMEALEQMVHAQAIKDATMAYFIHKELQTNVPFVHFHGDFHSANYGGIFWYLHELNKDLSISTISTVEGEGELAFKEEYASLADFIIVVANDMTQTSR